MARLSAPPDPGVAVVWSEEIAARIVDEVARGTPIYRLPSLPGMPSIPTIYEWKEKRPEWANTLARARASRAERLADEGLDIVDGCDGDSSSQVGKAREQSNYRRWLAGCLDRATYGEAVKIDATVACATVLILADMAPKPRVLDAGGVDDELTHVEAPRVDSGDAPKS